MDQNWVLLGKVPNLVLRGALEARLAEARIEAYIPERDAIAQVGDTVNLALGGYSAFFDGYPIFVRRDQLAEAQKVFADFEIEAYSRPEQKPAVDYLTKFYLAAYVSVIFPVIFHVVALYNLYKAFQSGPVKISWGRMLFAWFVLICTLGAAMSFVLHTPL